jgi:hypothetical protein
VGRRVARPADFRGYEVLFNGELLAPGDTLGSVMAEHEVLPLQWFDVRFRSGVPADA